jgi:hypothetical protein
LYIVAFVLMKYSAFAGVAWLEEISIFSIVPLPQRRRSIRGTIFADEDIWIQT